MPVGLGIVEEAPPLPDAWTARIDAEHAADNLTRSYRDALLALAGFRGFCQLSRLLVTRHAVEPG